MEQPAAHAHIESEQDIVDAVLAARDGAAPIRAVGSRGSKNSCFRTPGVALHFERYAGVLNVEDNLVVAQAGVTVGELNRVLKRHGLALPTHGEWAGATVAGAVATGTHGGSASHGIFATSVRAMRIITADGLPVTLQRGSEHFDHAAVSLGMLGITSTITFECVDPFHLELETRVLPFERYLLEHERHNREDEFYSAIWIPTARQVITFAANRVPAPGKTARRMERFCPRTFALHALSSRMRMNACPERWLTTTAVNDWDHILSPIRDASRKVLFLRFLSKGWRAAEFAVPLTRMVESLVRLDRFFDCHPRALANPVGLRVTAGDTFSLSPCAGRDTFWIDLFFHDDERFASTLGDLFEELDARCHWGKHISLATTHLRRQYPRWNAFRAARAQFDPDSIFANRFTRSFDL